MEVRKWHVYLADLNPKIGTEPREVRPMVVVKTDLLNSSLDHHMSYYDQCAGRGPGLKSPSANGGSRAEAAVRCNG